MKWWIYQKERFPLVAHGPLIVAFSACAVSYSALLGGDAPCWREYVVAFCVCLMMFLQLRIADEFKDAEDDARWRPYRPVPRGLVTLAELRLWFIGCAVMQVAFAMMLDEKLLWVLAIAWTYLALMCVEFFCRDWLKARPVIYLLTHMGIMPLVDWFATACHWMPRQSGMPDGLGWFLAASFFNGLVIELGRKIRQPQDEEEGVETYSRLWGRKNALGAWWLAMALTAACGWQAASMIGFAGWFTLAMAFMFLCAVICGLRYGISHQSGRGIELCSAVWTLVLYVTLGVIPLWLR